MKCDRKKLIDCPKNCDLKKGVFFDAFTLQSSTLVLVTLGFLGFFVFLSQNLFGLADFFMGHPIIHDTFTSISTFWLLPLLIILIPFVGGVGQIIIGVKSCQARDGMVIFLTFITIVLIMLTFPSALSGGFSLELPGVLGLGISFHIDMLGFTMLLITSVLWFLVMVYAHEYMKKEMHCDRFFLFMAVTYSSVLGAIMSGDLLTMFLFFEVMTIASYMLVTHGQKEESFQAGYNYIFMGLIGGFAILIAILLIYVNIGDLHFQSAIATLSTLGNTQYYIIGLLVFGFGIKAGMAPVHVWLPRAHPVAPTPASALLSGIMIKVGAFGILRVATSYYFPASGTVTNAFDPIWLTAQTVGAAIIWLGVITMAVGVFLALQQAHIKRMLAYHSISQMGYILMGIGVALYLGYKGAMGYSGALYHIINHALFKSLLFMVAGVVYFHTRETDMYKLGGLWRKLPLTATVCLIAAFGISGVPLFNGFISKSILHHGIVEAYTYGHPSFFYAEMIFIVVSAGTVCSFIKLFYYVFLRKMPEQYKSIVPEYTCLDTSMVTVAIFIIVIGLFPYYILNTLIVPQLNALAYDPSFIGHYILGLQFYTRNDLLTMAVIIAMGFVIFVIGTRFHLFHLKLPSWLRIETLFFFPANVLIRLACKSMYGKQCELNLETYQKLALRNNPKMGFLDRFVILSNVFNRKYEATIIKSDAFIYTLFITIIFLFMLFFSSI